MFLAKIEAEGLKNLSSLNPGRPVYELVTKMKHVLDFDRVCLLALSSKQKAENLSAEKAAEIKHQVWQRMASLWIENLKEYQDADLLVRVLGCVAEDEIWAQYKLEPEQIEQALIPMDLDSDCSSTSSGEDI